jgi:hypothetical protein
MATCPKCNSTDVHSDRMHKAAHGLHHTMHAMKHISPVFGLGVAVLAGIGVLNADRQCRRCHHKF